MGRELEQLLALLRSAPNLVLTGDFTFASGIKSKTKIDVENILEPHDVQMREALVAAIAPRIPKETTLLYTTGVGGEMLTSLLSEQLSIPYLQLVQKTDDAPAVLVGPIHSTLFCIDDVYTRGTTMRRMHRAITPLGARVTGALTLFSYQDPIVDSGVPFPISYLFATNAIGVPLLQPAR